MPAIESLRTALRSLASNPVLFLAGLLYGLVVLPQTAVQLLGVPFAPLVLQVLTFFITPFVVAGLIGMAAEATTGDGTGGTTFGTFSTVGRERYVPLLLGNLIQFGIVVLFGILFFVVALAGVVALGASGFLVGGVPSGGLGAGVVAVVAVVAVLLLAFLLVFFFIQFFQVAIVADDADAVEGFKESASLVRSNLLSTLGYSVINFLVGLLISLPVTGFVLFRTLQRNPATTPGGGTVTPPTGGFGGMGSLFSTTEVVALTLVTVALAMVLTTFQQTYATAFYRRHQQSVEDRVLDEETTVG